MRRQYASGGLVFNSAATATRVNATYIHNRLRLEESQFSYSGHLYGVGASVGLTAVDALETAGQILAYWYTETGYFAQANCIRIGGIRTMVWARMLRLSHTDVKGILIGAPMGGTSIAEMVCSIHLKGGTGLAGDSSDKVAGDILARLRSAEGHAAAAVANAADVPAGRRRWEKYVALRDVAEAEMKIY
ncbi:hypothetical protein FGG08_004411 [Glutinoglossum americanum]|uniref:Uncharacterized protein n=1 Tax=Glutinoglossum americanum TaxID=1670608 RepID=A0A9P8I559_9PEZI|nr:hypothetical protein FGG08_004411 [Glutinoglossum americanum]